MVDSGIPCLRVHRCCCLNAVVDVELVHAVEAAKENEISLVEQRQEEEEAVVLRVDVVADSHPFVEEEEEAAAAVGDSVVVHNNSAEEEEHHHHAHMTGASPLRRAGVEHLETLENDYCTLFAQTKLQ